jgi:hypothetical protein
MIETARYWIDSRNRAEMIAREIARLDVGPGRIAEVIIRPARKEKTADQRRLFHAICAEIGLAMGATPGQVKYAIKADFYGLETFRVGEEVYVDVQSSEDSDRAEYTRLIDHAYLWAAEREVVIQDRRPAKSGEPR